MPSTPDIIIIGAGHNGLVAATYLAKAGWKPLVLERRPIVGGAAITDEIHPGFKCSTLSYASGPLLPQIEKDLRLDRFGLQTITPDIRVLALHPNSQPVALYNDPVRTATELKEISAADAGNYPAFHQTFGRIGKVLSSLVTMTPPAVEKTTPSELWNLGKIGLQFRSLDKKDAFRLLRWGPMAVADLVAEWFENELLRATIAARGIFGSFAGPWSAGTSAGLLWQAAFDRQAIAPSSFFKGGLGALTQALSQAALDAGAEIRTSADVVRIESNGDRVVKVVLSDGEELVARAVVSNADPRTTFLKLLDPTALDPNFLMKVQNFRGYGVSAKVNLALSALPSFTGLADDAAAKLSGRIHIGPDIDYLERAFDAAKYGDYSPEPYLDITIPTLTDSSLAPEGAHVMSIYAQFAPYALKHGDWTERRQELGDVVVNLLAHYAPNLKDLIIARQVITPFDLEQTYGLSGGQIFHGEHSLDQFFTFRPLIGWAQYRTPIKGLYLCGAGTHPGGGITGGPGFNASREIIKDFRAKRV